MAWQGKSISGKKREDVQTWPAYLAPWLNREYADPVGRLGPRALGLGVLGYRVYLGPQVFYAPKKMASGLLGHCLGCTFEDLKLDDIGVV